MYIVYISVVEIIVVFPSLICSTILMVNFQCFCLSVVTNLFILFVHVGTTGRYHNESLDSLTIILLYGSFLKIVVNILFTHHCIHASCHVH